MRDRRYWKILLLVPLIFYMDGISLDAHGRLSLTPLNMTLGIFSTETRKRPEAWSTIYFHPRSNFTQGIIRRENACDRLLDTIKENY